MERGRLDRLDLDLDNVEKPSTATPQFPIPIHKTPPWRPLKKFSRTRKQRYLPNILFLYNVSNVKSQGVPAFVTFITAGYPRKDDTVPILLAMQAGGADIVELGVPFSDPIADGPVIQEANTVSL